MVSRERARQARANRLAHAVEVLDYDDKENDLDSASLGRALYSMLEPAEEELVDRLLAQVWQLVAGMRIKCTMHLTSLHLLHLWCGGSPPEPDT